MITVPSVNDGGFSNELGVHVQDVVLTDGDTTVQCNGCVWDGTDDLEETFEYWLTAAEDGIEGFATL